MPRAMPRSCGLKSLVVIDAASICDSQRRGPCERIRRGDATPESCQQAARKSSGSHIALERRFTSSRDRPFNARMPPLSAAAGCILFNGAGARHTGTLLISIGRMQQLSVLHCREMIATYCGTLCQLSA